MNHPDIEYQQLLQRVLYEGNIKDDRTGTGTISLFGPQMEFDLSKGFPLLTTKKVPMRLIVAELLWFLSGNTNIRELLEKNVHIWDGDAYRWHKENHPKSTMSKERYLEAIKEGLVDSFSLGDLGPIYGKQWRSWQVADTYYEEGLNTVMLTNEKIDQLQDVIDGIKNNPNSRRHLVSAWNPGEIKDMALPPCHALFQFYVSDGELSCKMYQRSGDLFLGVPFNIASYALLTHIVAKMTGLKVGKFIHTFGDAHIYLNHIKQVEKQLARKPRELPELKINAVHDFIENYTEDDIELTGYNPHGPIKGDVSVGL